MAHLKKEHHDRGLPPKEENTQASPFRLDLSEICNGNLLTLEREFANIMETFPSISIYYQYYPLKIYKKLQVFLLKVLI